jgi:aquaglyceroporin related protein, other eukaryote
VLGLLVAILKMALGFNIGSALNPASDFGPRLIAYAVGYHQDSVFKDPWWFYGPWAATFVGSTLGCVIYDTFVFVGTESPVNYRYPPTIRRKIEKKGRQIKQKGHQVLNHLSSGNDDNDKQ